MNNVAPVKRTSGRSFAALEESAKTLFKDCLDAFHAIGELDELAENLRILSLNAELAAGRAGPKGRAVRALTQYTRELVNRLSSIQNEMRRLRERTETLGNTCLKDFEALRAANLGQERERVTRELEQNIHALTQSVEEFANRTRFIGEVVTQSDSIATNIAIEAAAAGEYEKEFRTVSDTMRRYIEDLRQMLEVVSDSVRKALDRGRALRSADLVSLQERGR